MCFDIPGDAACAANAIKPQLTPVVEATGQNRRRQRGQHRVHSDVGAYASFTLLQGCRQAEAARQLRCGHAFDAIDTENDDLPPAPGG